MARIRSIKPEFWTDEKIVKLPYEARLLFIGMWNFADDEGYVPDEPERLRLQILPSDPIDASAVVDLLCAAELVERIVYDDGQSALRIRGFVKHQKISHATPSKFSSGGKKVSMPAAVRREVAIKYGCKPGSEIAASCYHCGAEGRIVWWSLCNGKPGAWVSFSDLELDHFVPEVAGGATAGSNIVLSCRSCNRSRGHRDSLEFFSRKIPSPPENSGNLRPDMEGKGKGDGEGKEGERASAPSDPKAIWFEGKSFSLTKRDFGLWEQRFRDKYPDLWDELTRIDDKLSVEGLSRSAAYLKAERWLTNGAAKRGPPKAHAEHLRETAEGATA